MEVKKTVDIITQICWSFAPFSLTGPVDLNSEEVRQKVEKFSKLYEMIQPIADKTNSNVNENTTNKPNNKRRFKFDC